MQRPNSAFPWDGLRRVPVTSERMGGADDRGFEAAGIDRGLNSRRHSSEQYSKNAAAPGSISGTANRPPPAAKMAEPNALAPGKHTIVFDWKMNPI